MYAILQCGCFVNGLLWACGNYHEYINEWLNELRVMFSHLTPEGVHVTMRTSHAAPHVLPVSRLTTSVDMCYDGIAHARVQLPPLVTVAVWHAARG
jgi:hypothetical protein